MKIEDISPSNWILEVEKQIKELEDYLRNIQNKTSNKKTNIRIITNKGTEQYYLVNKREKSVQYIQKKNMELIKKITQENYYEKIIPKVKKEITFLKKIKEDFQSIDILNYYKNMPEKRKKLITPPTLSDHEYTKKWQQVKYFGKKIEDNEDKYETSWGLKVRSKSEIIIAETLKLNEIPFRYEYPIKMDGVKVYPDFYCLNVRTRQEYIWEHLGRLDDAEYIEKNLKKFAAYTKHKIAIGDNLIITYETKNFPLTKKMIDLQIEKFLK